jgi:hypothetical protein
MGSNGSSSDNVGRSPSSNMGPTGFLSSSDSTNTPRKKAPKPLTEAEKAALKVAQAQKAREDELRRIGAMVGFMSTMKTNPAVNMVAAVNKKSLLGA